MAHRVCTPYENLILVKRTVLLPPCGRVWTPLSAFGCNFMRKAARHYDDITTRIGGQWAGSLDDDEYVSRPIITAGAANGGRIQLSAHCKNLQGQMLAWAANEGAFPKAGYDGTIASLARQYFSHEFSPYRKLQWNSRIHHDKQGKIIVGNVGARQIGKLLGPNFLQWAAKWGAPAAEGKPPRPWRAKHCMDTVVRMIAFGVTLGYQDCAHADSILGKLRFPTPPARRSRMTFDQDKLVRDAAHQVGLGSIALATVLQFELSLRQKT